MKKFMVSAVLKHYFYATIEAKDYEEAREKSEDLVISDFEQEPEDDDWEVWDIEEMDDEDYEDEDYEDYTPSATRGDYSPSNPWDAPGMSMSDFI